MQIMQSDEAVLYLKQKDKRLGEVIDVIGPVAREKEGDLFSSVVRQIVGQQISMAAQITVWQRIQNTFGRVTPDKLAAAEIETLQKNGITYRKAEYIKDFAQKVHTGTFDLDALYEKTDREVVEALSSLKGVGEWTAEMLMIFCMGRPDILSFGDLAIHRGMRMVYHHRSIDRDLFEKYRRRYSPYGTVASLYLWAVAGGAVPGMKDYAPKKKKTTGTK